MVCSSANSTLGMCLLLILINIISDNPDPIRLLDNSEPWVSTDSEGISSNKVVRGNDVCVRCLGSFYRVVLQTCLVEFEVSC